MTKKQFLFMFNARPTLPPKHFSADRIKAYEENLEKWYRMICDDPPFKPGRRVRCICGFWGPDEHGFIAEWHKGWTARVLRSAWDYAYGYGGHGASLTGSESDALNGYDNSIREFYKYDLLFDKDKDREAWWFHSYLEPVTRKRKDAVK